MTPNADDIAYWQNWVGKTETMSQRLEVESLRRFAAALGEPLNVETQQPSLAHWAFFLPVAGPDQIGHDGHSKRGAFLPPISLPRRMFAASEMRFYGALALGKEATRISRILSVTHKNGRSGNLMLVEVLHEIAQGDELRVGERQTIVYRDAGDPIPAAAPAEVGTHPDDVNWQPGTVDLFRFSAVTFNSHRIHYDLPYAMVEEGYPGLVVHGPFTAARLLGHARRDGRNPSAFAFRALAPLFAGQPILLTMKGKDELAAIRCDGTTAMAATVEYR